MDLQSLAPVFREETQRDIVPRLKKCIPGNSENDFRTSAGADTSRVFGPNRRLKGRQEAILCS